MLKANDLLDLPHLSTQNASTSSSHLERSAVQENILLRGWAICERQRQPHTQGPDLCRTTGPSRWSHKAATSCLRAWRVSDRYCTFSTHPANLSNSSPHTYNRTGSTSPTVTLAGPPSTSSVATESTSSTLPSVVVRRATTYLHPRSASFPQKRSSRDSQPLRNTSAGRKPLCIRSGLVQA